MPGASRREVFAERDEDRLYRRLRALTADDLSSDEVRELAAGDLSLVADLPYAARAGVAALVDPAKVDRAGVLEKMVGAALDVVPIAYLDSARLAANAVARIVSGSRRGVGTGTLVSPRLLLTNSHVTPDADAAAEQVAQFDYELGVDGVPRQACEFRLDPTAFFWTSPVDELDATLVAIGPQVTGDKALSAFGMSSLTAARDKHAEGDFVTVVQHPQGDFKQIALRENRVVGRGKGGRTLHYEGDTLPGSSGSPVFNDQFQLVALHHAGGHRNETTLEDGRAVPADSNEGIRVSSIVTALRTLLDDLSPAARPLLAEALDPPVPGPRVESTPAMPTPPQVSVAPGQADVLVPVRLVFGAPAAAAAGTVPRVPGRLEQNSRPDPDYANRRGYDARFLGVGVALPQLSAGQIETAARPRDGDALTLDYVHFSVVQNAERRMPFFTAVNIDGKRARDINRRTGEVEGGEAWFPDPRIPLEHQLNQVVFEAQRPRIFDRGHLVRRLDPAWGSAVTASRGANDTFHFTNCTLQVGAFNQRAAMWAGIENYVLNNARADRKRVSVFSGPVFRPDDPAYRGVPVPMDFWKIVVRREHDELRATAFLASQGHLLPDGLESFDELGRVAVFQTTVMAIMQATGLDFGPLPDVDSRKTESAAAHELSAFDQVEW